VVREAPATSALFGVCIVVFLIAQAVGDTRTDATLIQFGASGRRWVWAGQYWRLLTSMFLHIGFLHIVLNVWFGFRICELAEKQLGSWRFLVLYLGSGIVGSAVSVIGHDALSAGASGALFGVVGWMLVTLRLRFGSLRAFVQNAAIRQQLIWIAAWFVIGVYAHFDNYAHGGGLLFGALYTWAVAEGVQPRKRRGRLVLALGVGVALVLASLHPLPFLHQALPPVPFAGGD
jgi:rhomboid protease GluP